MASRASQIPHTIAPIPPDFCVAISWKVFSALEDGGSELWPEYHTREFKLLPCACHVHSFRRGCRTRGFALHIDRGATPHLHALESAPGRGFMSDFLTTGTERFRLYPRAGTSI